MVSTADKLVRLRGFIAASPAKKRPQPQNSDQEKREKIDEQVPAAKPRRSHLDIRHSFSAALRSLEQHAHPPHLLGVERNLGFELRAATQLLTRRRMAGFRKPPGYWLNSDFHLDVVRDRGAWRRFQNDKEGSDSHIGISPDRHHNGADRFINDDRVGRPFVRARRK